MHRRKLVKISGVARGARIIGGGRGEWLGGGTLASAEPANLAPLQKCLALHGMNGLTVDLSALGKTSANN